MLDDILLKKKGGITIPLTHYGRHTERVAQRVSVNESLECVTLASAKGKLAPCQALKSLTEKLGSGRKEREEEMDLLKNPSCRHKNSNALRGFLLFIQHTVSAFQGYATYALLTHQNTHTKKKSIILTFLEPGCWLRSFVLHCIKFLAQNTFYMQIRASYCRKTRANLLLCQRFAHFSVRELWLAFAQKVKMRSRPSDFFFSHAWQMHVCVWVRACASELN